MKWVRPLFLLIGVCSAALGASDDAANGPGEFDRFGGWKAIRFEPAAFFRTRFDGERWWLVTPEGHAFLSIGVNNVTPVGDTARGTNSQPYRENVLSKHGNVAAWAASTRDRLRAWGFNTLACWSTRDVADMPRTDVMNFSAGVGGDWLTGGMPDYFGAAFVENAARVARGCRDSRDDPWLIGYFLDNELAWDTDWRAAPPLFDRYAALPAAASGKQAWCRCLRERHGTCEAFGSVYAPPIASWDELPALTSVSPRKDRTEAAKADRDAFALLVARQYFRTCADAIRREDPHHLILGCRFVSWTVPRAVVQACGEFCDVVSINFYELGVVGEFIYQSRERSPDWRTDQLDFEPFFKAAGKPLMVTEFSFRATDSGMPNTYPPPLAVQPTVPTQQIRAERCAHYVDLWMRRPFFVGYHWFEWVDEPKEGRFDGENGNYGLVNIRDEPYQVFVDAASRVNGQAWSRHRSKSAQEETP
jgi:hypothetical protein